MKLSDFDGISERLIGWGSIAAAVTEYIDPSFLAITLSQAAGFGTFGVLLATGRANAAVKAMSRIFRND